MKYGIFGCTADPFTEAHQAIVSKLLTSHIVDYVIVAPTIVDYHRAGKEPWLDDNQKIDIIYERLSNDAGIKSLHPMKRGYWSVWDKDFRIREICSKSQSLQEKYVNGHRFIDTLLAIIERYDCNHSLNEYYVVMGSDEFRAFKSWHMWEDIAKLATIVVALGRDSMPLPDESSGYPPCITLDIGADFAGVSATKDRAEWRSRGFLAYKEHVIQSLKPVERDTSLLHTPIFDVVHGAMTSTGLKPVKVNAPDWVTVIVKKGQNFLVESQLRHGRNVVVKEFPCGQVEHNESPCAAALRELEEETGIQLVDKNALKHIASASPNPAFMTNMMHYFFVDLDSTSYVQVKQHLDEHECIELKWENASGFIAHTTLAAKDGRACVPAMLLAAFSLCMNNGIHI